jgi:copper(I)-binding protein
MKSSLSFSFKALLSVFLATSAAAVFAAENQLAAKAAITPPVISNVWIREAPAVAKNNVAFLMLKNGDEKDTLLGVETPVAKVAEMHDMSMGGGLMRMQRLPLIDLQPGQVIEFVPSGRHIMLINMTQALKVGDKVPLTLLFRHAGKITVQAEVRALVVDDGMKMHHGASVDTNMNPSMNTNMNMKMHMSH